MKLGICLGLVVCLIGCSETPKMVVQPVRSQAEIDAARLARRADRVLFGDSSFLKGDFLGAGEIYSRGAEDPDEGISSIAKRKLASVYEVQRNDKAAYKLLNELAAIQGNVFGADPLNILKRLFFADRLKDISGFAKILGEASTAQRKAFDVIHDPQIAPGTKGSLFYWLALEADGATDKVLFDWAIQKADNLSDQQWLQVASTLVSTDPIRATAILKRIEPKLEGDDKNHQSATLQKIKEVDGEPKAAPVIQDVDLIPYVIKYKATGYWVTGKIPNFRIFKMKMGQAR